jgi:putative ABC transport system permease protein
MTFSTTVLALTLKGLWAHKLRFLLTGLAVILGVSFMSGSMILTDTMAATFDELLAENNEGVDAVVQRPAAIEGMGDDVRERLDESMMGVVDDVDGVSAAFGSVQGFAQLVRADGDVAQNVMGATIGTNWIDDARLNPLDLAAGAAPRAPGEAVVDRATVEAQGWSIGDRFTVLGKTGAEDLRLVGVATFGEIDGIPGSTMIATDLPTAQTMFGEPGSFDTILVARDGSLSADELALGLRSAFAGDDVEVLTGAADTAAKQHDLRENLKFFNTFLLSFAYIALFVGVFIIYNTFSIVVAQRTRDLAMIRAIGASRAQVIRSVLIEALAVAAVSVATGLVAGVGMSFALRALIARVGLSIPNGPIVITSSTVVTSAIVGALVTLASALAPALRAGRVAPIAALREVTLDRSHLSIKRAVAGIVVIALGVLVSAAGVKGSGSSALSQLGLGAVATLVGLFVLGPVVARPILRVLGAPARTVSGTVGHLAVENARRNPKRTAATAAALMIGVGLVGFITIIASSATVAVERQVDQSFRADYVIESGQWGEGGLSPDLAAELRTLPRVAAISPVRVAPVLVDGRKTQVAGVDASSLEAVYDLEPVAGHVADLDAGRVAVESGTAADNGLDVGDHVTMTFARTGDVDMTVAMIFESEIAGTGSASWIVDLAAYEANVTDQYDRQVYVRFESTADAAASRAAIDAVLDDWPNGELQDQAEFKQSIISEINQLLNLIYGLLALAIVIALIGIANTLALSVHERTRELGLMRAVGMLRSQVRAMVRWESVLIAVFGTGLGLALSLAGAWTIVQALSEEGITEVVVPVGRLSVIVAVAVVAGVVAALLPARRAARLDVLRAISSE